MPLALQTGKLIIEIKIVAHKKNVTASPTLRFPSLLSVVFICHTLLPSNLIEFILNEPLLNYVVFQGCLIK